MATYTENQTATNPETGERFVYKGGVWERMGSGGESAIGETPGFQQSLKTPDLKNPYTGKDIPGVDTGITPEFLTDMLPAALGTAGGIAGTITAPGVGTAILGGLGSGAGEAIRQEIREGQGFAPATGVMQEWLDLDPTGTAAKVSGVASEALAGLLSEFAALRGTKAVAPTREKALRRFVSAIEDPKVTQKAFEGTVDTMRPIARDLPVGTRRSIARKAERKLGPAGEAVEEVYTEAGNRPSTYFHAQRKLKEASEDLIETPETTLIDEVSRPGRSIATGEPQEVVEQIQRTINKEQVRDEPLKKAFDERATKLGERESARKARGEALGEDQYITVLETWKQRKQDAIDARRAASDVFSGAKSAKEYVPKAQAAMKEYEGLRETLHALVPEGKNVDDIYHAWSTMLDTATKAERNHFMARWASMGAFPGRLGRVAGIAASAPTVYKTALSKTGMMLADALEAGNATRARQIFRGFIDASMQPDTKPLGEAE